MTCQPSQRRKLPDLLR